MWWIFFTVIEISSYAPLRAGEVNLNTVNEQRALSLGKKIRCAVCQGMSITDSPAPMAQAMLDRVREMVSEGKNDQEINEYFVQRYGEFILLEPKAEGMNWVVWLFPFLFLGVGIIVVANFYRQHRNRPQ